jgi:hypothetical protein
MALLLVYLIGSIGPAMLASPQDRILSVLGAAKDGVATFVSAELVFKKIEDKDQ